MSTSETWRKWRRYEHVTARTAWCIRLQVSTCFNMHLFWNHYFHGLGIFVNPGSLKQFDSNQNFLFCLQIIVNVFQIALKSSRAISRIKAGLKTDVSENWWVYDGDRAVLRSSVFNPALKRLIAREDFSAFIAVKASRLTCSRLLLLLMLLLVAVLKAAVVVVVLVVFSS
jgi:hypothetical protein